MKKNALVGLCFENEHGVVQQILDTVAEGYFLVEGTDGTTSVWTAKRISEVGRLFKAPVVDKGPSDKDIEIARYMGFKAGE